MIETGRFKAWAVLEIMGHRKIAGLVTEVELAGATMLRVEIPSDPPVVQCYGGKSIFALTEESEERCRAYSVRNRPEVISRYELPATTERGLEPVDADEVDPEECSECGLVLDAASRYDDDLCNGCAEDRRAEGDLEDQLDSELVTCDLCDDTVHPGEDLHTVKGADGTELDACGKCARAEADTKPTRVPAQHGVGLVTDRSAVKPDPVGSDENLAGNQDERQVTSERPACPYCAEFPIAIGVGGLPRSTCGRDACLDVAAREAGAR